jgi:hypothetical protein
METNNISQDRYCLVPMGLADRRQEILFEDTGTQGTGVLLKGSAEGIITDLDSFVNEKGINVGFIKADLEGYGLKGLKGMINTIKSFRPVLSLPIYHSTEEFFEMKPILDEIVKDKNYRIKVRHFDVFVGNTTDITLFAYPAELDEGD